MGGLSPYEQGTMLGRKHSSGFTLIEVMVTVAIVAILASVALPSYRNYTIRGKIPDATANLSAKRVKMEQWFQDNRTYAVTSPATNAGDLDQTSSKYFDFSTKDDSNTDTRSASGYTLYARGKGSMAGFKYTLDQAGTKTTTITGVNGWTGSSSTCWIIRQGGAC